MCSNEELTDFSDEERKLIEGVAMARGVTFEEAANQLVHEGMARRVNKNIHHRPSSQVMNFQKAVR